MKKWFFLIVLFLVPVVLRAQSLHAPFSRYYTGIGAYSRSFISPFSFSTNQAALAQTKKPGAGIYSERPYFLKELARYSCVAIIPVNGNGIGVLLNHSGNNSYRQSQVGIAYGRKLSDRIDVGAQFNYHRVTIPAYVNAGVIGVELGALIHISEKVHAGMHIVNPLGRMKKGERLRLAYINTFGLGYEASEKLFLQMEISKEENLPLRVSSTIQYTIKEEVYLRAGVLTNTGSLYAGWGLKWKQFRTDIAASYHPVLGVTPSLLITYSDL